MGLIYHHNWTKFLQQPDEFIPTLVQEFYSNIDNDGNYTWVRGKIIYFSADAINTLYGLDEVDDTTAIDVLNHSNIGEIADVLCPYGMDWIYKPTGEPDFFRGINIHRIGRALLYFINSRLFPNPNHDEIRVRRATLIFAIYKGMRVNVGKIINEQINFCRRDNSIGSFYFPCLVTALIKKMLK